VLCRFVVVNQHNTNTLQVAYRVAGSFNAIVGGIVANATGYYLGHVYSAQAFDFIIVWALLLIVNLVYAAVAATLLNSALTFAMYWFFHPGNCSSALLSDTLQTSKGKRFLG